MRLVFTLFFTLVTTLLSATNYYVKNGGNDSNSGLDDANAWAHHPWMSNWTGQVTLRPGDAVFLKRGNTWSISNPVSAFLIVRQSGSLGNPITTSAYGSGNKPILKILTDTDYPVILGYGKSYITFDNLEICHFSSSRRVNTSQDGILFGKDASLNVPHDWIIDNCEIHEIPSIGIRGFDDSYNILIGNLTYSEIPTSGRFSNHIYNCGYAGIFLSGRNPVTDKSDFNIIGNYIHDIDVNTNEIRDSYGIAITSLLQGSGQWYSDGWPSVCNIRYNSVRNVPGHTGIDSHGGSYLYIQDNYVFNANYGIVGQAADREGRAEPILDHCFIERNTIENPGNHPFQFYRFIMVIAENSNKRVTETYIRNNTIFYTQRPSSENLASGIMIANVDRLSIEGNRIFNGPVGSCNGGLYFSSTSEEKVSNIIVKGNWIKDWGAAIAFRIDALDGEISFINNIVNSHYRPFVAGGGILTKNISIYNNTFLSAKGSIFPNVVDFAVDGLVTVTSDASLNILNNIIGFTSGDPAGRYIFAPGIVNGNLEINNNIYWNSSNSSPFRLMGTNYSWDSWKTVGYDTKSPNINSSIDPLFSNYSGSLSSDMDLNLSDNSPAIDHGTLISEVPNDFSGNIRDNLPDIGAFEFKEAIVPIKVKEITITSSNGSNLIQTYKGTLQLLASVSPSDASNGSVTWSITNGSEYGFIDSNGLISAKSNGTMTVKASANDGSGVFDTLDIIIINQKVLVKSITVTGINGVTTISTFHGTLQLNASVLPSDASDRTVRWSIINGSGQATISESGLVSAVTDGTVTAIATANDGSGISGRMVLTLSNQTVAIDPVFINSTVENATPTIVELNFNIQLVNTLPSSAAFVISLNSSIIQVKSVSLSGTKVLLGLNTKIYKNDLVTVSYSVPPANQLQSINGLTVSSIKDAIVINRVLQENSSPNIILNYKKDNFSGFIGTVDANGCFDPEGDKLQFLWKVPDYLSVSSKTGPVLNFLSPETNIPKEIPIELTISDGRTKKTDVITLDIFPFRADLKEADIESIEASSYITPYSPDNIIDKDLNTIWYSEGINEWIMLKLRESFNVELVKIAFKSDLRFESYFDVLGSCDGRFWESILLKTTSCAFSGGPQVFELPPSKTIKEFKYIKVVGLGNANNIGNYISEIRILGYPIAYSDFEENIVKIFPNPARNFVNIQLEEPLSYSCHFKIFDLNGKLALNEELEPAVQQFYIPLNLKNGIYIIYMESDQVIYGTKKLLIAK